MCSALTGAWRRQAEAERRKRAQILESEGARQSKINVAEGNKADIILSSEAAQQDSINRAMGAPQPTTKHRLRRVAAATIAI